MQRGFFKKKQAGRKMQMSMTSLKKSVPNREGNCFNYVHRYDATVTVSMQAAEKMKCSSIYVTATIKTTTKQYKISDIVSEHGYACDVPMSRQSDVCKLLKNKTTSFYYTKKLLLSLNKTQNTSGYLWSSSETTVALNLYS